MKVLKSICMIMMCALLPLAGYAHGYWLETEGGHKLNEAATIKMFYGEYESGERLSGKSLDKMKDIKVYIVTPAGEKQEVIMKQTNDYWEGSFIPSQEGAYAVTGINDVREVQDWTKHDLGIVRPIQYLKTVYQVGDGKKTGAQQLYIDADMSSMKDGSYEVTVIKDGKKLPEQKIVYGYFNGAGREATTDKKGKAALNMDKPGIYVISIEWIDKTPGSFKDKKYESTRHRLDYSVYR